MVAGLFVVVLFVACLPESTFFNLLTVDGATKQNTAFSLKTNINNNKV